MEFIFKEVTTEHTRTLNTASVLTNEKPTWYHLLVYFTYYALNMFRTLIYPSSGACNCVDEQHSRRLLKMDTLMSETCCAHNKWNKLASDIKLVFHSSTIAMMHGPINIRFTASVYRRHAVIANATELET